jgi:hypothetical protein
VLSADTADHIDSAVRAFDPGCRDIEKQDFSLPDFQVGKRDARAAFNRFADDPHGSLLHEKRFLPRETAVGKLMMTGEVSLHPLTGMPRVPFAKKPFRKAKQCQRFRGEGPPFHLGAAQRITKKHLFRGGQYCKLSVPQNSPDRTNSVYHKTA